MRINAIQYRETKEEREDTNERVFKDREYVVEAAIVRIMKARKTLTHAQLMSEVLQQCKFSLNVKDVKDRIEKLREREFLMRDESDINLWHYVA
jgi:cullin-4